MTLKSFRILLALCAVLVLASCGYRIQAGDRVDVSRGINVPFVFGDIDGQLTQELVKELATRGCLIDQRDCCNLLLSVKLIEIRDENIGFRYDRKKREKLTHSIVPVETRVFAKAQVSVEDLTRSCTLLGPVYIEAWYDYDNDYYYSQNGVNVFSLGQLSDYETAREAAKRPLYKVLSRKIADYVLVSW